MGWGWLSGNDLSNHILGSSHQVIWQVTGYMVLAAVVGVACLLRNRATLFFVVAAIGFSAITFAVPETRGDPGRPWSRSASCTSEAAGARSPSSLSGALYWSRWSD